MAHITNPTNEKAVKGPFGGGDIAVLERCMIVKIRESKRSLELYIVTDQRVEGTRVDLERIIWKVNSTGQPALTLLRLISAPHSSVRRDGSQKWGSLLAFLNGREVTPHQRREI